MNLQKMNAIMFRIFYLTLVVMLLSCSNKPAGNQTAATTPEVKRTEGNPRRSVKGKKATNSRHEVSDLAWRAIYEQPHRSRVDPTGTYR